MPAELLRVDAQSPQNEVMRYAAHFLTRGCVVGIPTDTFYGLAADPFNLAAVDEIYRVKGRPETRALPILVNSLEQALMLLRDREEESNGIQSAPRSFLRLAQMFWPGGLTLVMDASNRVPLKVTANTGKVADFAEDGERLFEFFLGDFVIALVVKQIADHEESASGAPPIARRNEEISGLIRKVNHLLRLAHALQSVALQLERLGDEQIGTGRATTAHCPLGQRCLPFEVAHG